MTTPLLAKAKQAMDQYWQYSAALSLVKESSDLANKVHTITGKSVADPLMGGSNLSSVWSSIPGMMRSILNQKIEQ